MMVQSQRLGLLDAGLAESAPDIDDGVNMETILLVDDDELTLTLLSTRLQRAGYMVQTAHSGLEAIAAVERQRPALAMLDIDMPGMSGLELAIQLKKRFDLAFMFLSAISDTDIIETAVEYGAVGYMLKPVELANLLPAIKASLARAEEIQQLKKSELSLSSALASGRETSMAIGILMARYQTDRHTAFDVMRNHARSRRVSLSEVANQILDAEESLNQFRHAFHLKLKSGQ